MTQLHNCVIVNNVSARQLPTKPGLFILVFYFSSRIKPFRIYNFVFNERPN